MSGTLVLSGHRRGLLLSEPPAGPQPHAHGRPPPKVGICAACVLPSSGTPPVLDRPWKGQPNTAHCSPRTLSCCCPRPWPTHCVDVLHEDALGDRLVDPLHRIVAAHWQREFCHLPQLVFEPTAAHSLGVLHCVILVARSVKDKELFPVLEGMALVSLGQAFDGAHRLV